jgi:hypothetical protein
MADEFARRDRVTATATCCRSCLERWHQIPKGRELSRAERGYVVDVICRWIEREVAGPPNPGAARSGYG